LEQAETITKRRLDLWSLYHQAFAELEAQGAVRRPIVPTHCKHNAHMYYLITRDAAARTALLSALRRAGVDAVFHYVPLHDSHAGRRFGRIAGEMTVTNDLSLRALRLPFWIGLEQYIGVVVDHVKMAMTS
jgi:dTDP-4-amino-4,6-dideoxygalactose transaminase